GQASPVGPPTQFSSMFLPLACPSTSWQHRNSLGWTTHRLKPLSISISLVTPPLQYRNLTIIKSEAALLTDFTPFSCSDQRCFYWTGRKIRTCARLVLTLTQISIRPQPNIREQEDLVGNNRRLNFLHHPLGTGAASSHQSSSIVGRAILNDFGFVAIC